MKERNKVKTLRYVLHGASWDDVMTAASIAALVACFIIGAVALAVKSFEVYSI